MLSRRLVFHFYVPQDYETNIAIKFHKECLKRYANVFDKAVFYVSVDEATKKYSQDVKEFILNLKEWEDVRIRVIQNDMLREARTFKTEIIDKLDTFNDEIIFFGHTKGASNVANFPDHAEHFLKWIHSLYFYSLEFMPEVEKKLLSAYQGRWRSLFGPLMSICADGHPVYPGAFFWITLVKI